MDNKWNDLLHSTVFSKRCITFVGIFVVLGCCVYFQRFVILYCLFTFPGTFEFISMSGLKTSSVVGCLAIAASYIYNAALAISVARVVNQGLARELPNHVAEKIVRQDFYNYTFTFLLVQCAILLSRELSLLATPKSLLVPSRKVLSLVAVGAIWCPGLTFFAALIATHTSIYFLAFLFITVGLQDNWQLVFGKLFGRHRPFPYLSPKKSMEGYVGGTIATVATIWYMQRYFPHDMRLAPVVVIFGIAGDLSMSAVKRSLQLKDTGDVLPGVGGLLDRMDSQVLILPVAYWLMSG